MVYSLNISAIEDLDHLISVPCRGGSNNSGSSHSAEIFANAFCYCLIIQIWVKAAKIILLGPKLCRWWAQNWMLLSPKLNVAETGLTIYWSLNIQQWNSLIVLNFNCWAQNWMCWNWTWPFSSQLWYSVVVSSHPIVLFTSSWSIHMPLHLVDLISILCSALPHPWWPCLGNGSDATECSFL